MVLTWRVARVRVGYKMVDSQWGMLHQVGSNYLISNKHKWDNCFIKNTHRIAIFELPGSSCQCVHKCTPITSVVHDIWAQIPWPVNQSRLMNCNLPWLVFNKVLYPHFDAWYKEIYWNSTVKLNNFITKYASPEVITLFFKSLSLLSNSVSLDLN